MPSSEPAETACPQSFEQSLSELQQIVAELEGGDIGLEESLLRFERGMSLLRACLGILQRTEQRIEILTGRDTAGEPVTAPFDASSTQSGDAPAAVPGRRRRRAAEPAVPPESTAGEAGHTLF